MLIEYQEEESFMKKSKGSVRMLVAGFILGLMAYFVYLYLVGNLVLPGEGQSIPAYYNARFPYVLIKMAIFGMVGTLVSYILSVYFFRSKKA